MFPKAAIVTHVLLMMHCMDHRSCAKEQQRLEECVRKEMEDAGRIGPDPARGKHVAELRAGRIGDHALDIVLHQTDGGGEEGGERAHDRDHLERHLRALKQR